MSPLSAVNAASLRPIVAWICLAVSVSLPLRAAEQDPADRVAAIVDLIGHNKPGDPQSLKSRGLSEEVFEVSERDLNLYLKGRLPSKVKEIPWAWARLKPGKLVETEVAVRIPLGEIEKLAEGPRGIIQRTVESLIKVENRLRVEALYTSAKGKGFLQVKRITVNDVEIPDAWVQELLTLAGDSLRPKADLHRLHDMNYGLEKVEILPGFVRIKLRAL
ncbi:MAG: hypothetical protein HY078_11980 [Elusimicrobia bacterium]|nr:hypothetical protein [Elusimicrobiota bacterium]